jgi:hypothetical protein
MCACYVCTDARAVGAQVHGHLTAARTAHTHTHTHTHTHPHKHTLYRGTREREGRAGGGEAPVLLWRLRAVRDHVSACAYECTRGVSGSYGFVMECLAVMFLCGLRHTHAHARAHRNCGTRAHARARARAHTARARTHQAVSMAPLLFIRVMCSGGRAASGGPSACSCSAAAAVMCTRPGRPVCSIRAAVQGGGCVCGRLEGSEGKEGVLARERREQRGRAGNEGRGQRDEVRYIHTYRRDKVYTYIYILYICILYIYIYMKAECGETLNWAQTFAGGGSTAE